MRRLPLAEAEKVELEAIAFVKRYWAGFLSLDHEAWTKQWARAALKQMAAKGADYTAAVIDMAERRDDVGDMADDVLLETGREFMDRNEPMGAMLNAYCQNAMRKPRPRHKPGADRTDHIARDGNIAMVVILVCKRFKLQPTRRRDETRRPSACSVVAAAVGIDEDSVVKTYGRWKDALLLHPIADRMFARLPA